MATVIDWEHPEQLDLVLSWAEEAARHIQRVVVIPKVSGLLGRIPERVGGIDVVLGYSVPTSYGASPVPLWEFGHRPVHLLGGSPHRQMDVRQYLHIVSADGSMAAQQANRCRYWSREKGPNGHWRQLSDTGDTKPGNANLRAFCRSLRNIQSAW